MIRSHNRRQLFRALGHFVVCLMATAASFGIFYGILALAERRFALKFSPEDQIQLAASAVIAFYLLGVFRAWREGRFALTGATDLFMDGAPFLSRDTLERYTKSYLAEVAYGLLAVFYAGPNRLIKGCQALRGIVRFSPQLESDLKRLQSRIETVGEWHDAKRYRNEGELLQHLVRMEQVDFSPHKCRIKAA